MCWHIRTQCMHDLYEILIHILFLNNNLVIYISPQIFVHEQGEWIDKGRYTTAVNLNKDIEWIKHKRDYILPVCYVRD